MYRLMTAAAAAALLALVLTQTNAAQPPNQGQPPQQPNLAQPDAKFIPEAASGGMLEVRLGQLATERSMNPDIKAFGQHMVTDHSKANKELLSIAQKKGIQVPAQLNAKDQQTYDMLAALQGAAFDLAYIQQMVKDHEGDVSEFRNFAQQGKDADFKKFASDTLPVIEGHLKMAKDIQAKLQR